LHEIIGIHEHGRNQNQYELCLVYLREIKRVDDEESEDESRGFENRSHGDDRGISAFVVERLRQMDTGCASVKNGEDNTGC
jgi:hypothetical protein